jgi:hypothetical protein
MVGWLLPPHVPFVGQESRWPAEDQDRYHRLLLGTTAVVVLGRDTDTTAAFQARNGVRRGGDHSHNFNCRQFLGSSSWGGFTV